MSKLFVFFVLAVLACTSAAPPDLSYREAIDAASKECKAELSYKEEDTRFLDFKAGLPINEAQSCLLTCVYTKLDFLKDEKLYYDGLLDAFIKYDGDRLEEKIKTAKKVFQRCQPKVDNQSKGKCASGVVFKACAANTINANIVYPEYE